MASPAICIARGHTRNRSEFNRFRLSMLTLALLAGCGGGGGGGGSEPAPQKPPPSQSPGAPGPIKIDPVVDGPDALHFVVDGALADDAGLDQAVQGDVFSAWNPTAATSPRMHGQGLRVMFFGRADGCANRGIGGPVVSRSAAELSDTLSLTAVKPAGANNARSWMPSGETPGCNADAQAKAGPSMVYLNADAKAGGLALFTSSGRGPGGAPAFLEPLSTDGQTGDGANAHIVGTFVAFQRNWRDAAALRPWAGGDAKPTARIVTTQSVGGTRLVSDSSDQVTQVKQQLAVGFLNRACMEEPNASGSRCQVKYLFNTAVYRAHVSDWSGQAWAKVGRVWADPAQGGIPIISGMLAAPGLATVDETTRLSLFTSAGNPTQHSLFRRRAFDVRISFAQLQNTLRIVAAQELAIDVDRLTDEQVRDRWGAGWNDPTAWVLTTATVGQEVYDETPDTEAWVGGSFTNLYIGPQG